MNLILIISKEKVGLITDVDQHLFVETSMPGGYVYHGDCILKTDPTVQRTGEKLGTIFLDMNSFRPLAMFHYSFQCGNYRWIYNTHDSTFPDIATVEENGP